MADPKIVIPFTLTNAQVLTLDTTSVTLATFDGSSRLVRVPTRLTIRKDEDTAAFALTRNLPYNLAGGDDAPVDRHLDADKSYRYAVEGGDAFLVVCETDGRPLFFIPADYLLQTVNEVNVVALPQTAGVVFKPGQTTYYIRSTVPIATGTVGLSGNLYFEEFPCA